MTYGLLAKIIELLRFHVVPNCINNHYRRNNLPKGKFIIDMIILKPKLTTRAISFVRRTDPNYRKALLIIILVVHLFSPY